MDERVATTDLVELEFEEHRRVLDDTKSMISEPFRVLSDACLTSVRNGGKILFCGNGGSAADAQHIATELTIRFRNNRPAIAAIALTTDTSALTACGNDLGFDVIFSRQIEALAKPGDVVICTSTSGNSGNILEALKAARAQDCVAAGLAGKDGGKMVGLADPLIVIPSETTARIQEMHILVGHMLCSAIEEGLGYA